MRFSGSITFSFSDNPVKKHLVRHLPNGTQDATEHSRVYYEILPSHLSTIQGDWMEVSVNHLNDVPHLAHPVCVGQFVLLQAEIGEHGKSFSREINLLSQNPGKSVLPFIEL
jgi:hypothetical protein